ncbi:MAG: phospholipid carrier-dependent glycosyltransferase, partial [Candidatus Aminicenantes bacterium]|nr:phospholipid carrier-dependent glycosyltransferase [Candidatus Aminicenantes bacterium]
MSAPSVSRAVRWSLAAVLALALAARVIGIGWGLPSIYHVDESWFAGLAVKHFQGNWDPDFFHVPSLFSYMVTGVWNLYYHAGKAFGKFESREDFLEAYYRDSTVFVVLGRLITILFSMGTVFFLFLIGRDMSRPRTGLLAALFLALSMEHVKISHHMVPDVAMVFFLMPAFFFIWKIYVRGRTADYLLAGAFAGLAFTVKYGGLFLFLPLVLAHAFRLAENRRPAWRFLLDARLAGAGLVFLAVFLLGTPYAVLNFQRFKTDFLWQSQHLTSTAHFGTPRSVPAWLFYLRHGFRENIGLLAQFLSLGGVVLGLVRLRKKDVLLLSMPLTMFLMIGSWKSYATRYLLPLAPFFILLAAVFLDHVLEKIVPLLRRVRPPALRVLAAGAGLAMAAVFLVPNVVRVARFNTLLTEPDTRARAESWVNRNIPPGTRVAIESDCPSLSRKRYTVLLQFSLADVDLDWLAHRRVRYVMVNDIMYRRFTDYPAEFPRQAGFYKSLDEKAILVKTITPRWDEQLTDLHNPTIKIYRLSSARDLSFPGNFDAYGQTVSLQHSVRGGWHIKTSIRTGAPDGGDEALQSPYLRITGKDGAEITKWNLRPGPFGRDGPEHLSAATRLEAAAGPYAIWLGYEYDLVPRPWTF